MGTLVPPGYRDSSCVRLLPWPCSVPQDPWEGLYEGHVPRCGVFILTQGQAPRCQVHVMRWGQTCATPSWCAWSYVDKCHAIGVFTLPQVQVLHCWGVSGCAGMGGMSLPVHGRTETCATLLGVHTCTEMGAVLLWCVWSYRDMDVHAHVGDMCCAIRCAW